MGGGGARPLNVPTEKYISQASKHLRNIYVFRSQNTLYLLHLLTYIINAVPFNVCHYKWQYTNKTQTLRKLYESDRSKRVWKMFAFSHSKSAISFNILLVLQILCQYKLTCLLAYTYRQISKCISKTQKKLYWGELPPPPLPGYASGSTTSRSSSSNKYTCNFEWW